MFLKYLISHLLQTNLHHVTKPVKAQSASKRPVLIIDESERPVLK
ncbi:hypothetical protein [Chengkuizengella marina]|nr:hypothetical protein [Chengkuizengella marina]